VVINNHMTNNTFNKDKDLQYIHEYIDQEALLKENKKKLRKKNKKNDTQFLTEG